MAEQAECTHIRQIALPSAFRDRHDVIRIPKRFAAALAKLPLFEESAARGEVQLAHIAPQRDRIHAALRANAPIARQYFIAQISRVGPQFPFVNAGFGAESPSSFRYLRPAPSAERTASRAAFEHGRRGPSTGFGSCRMWCQPIIFPQRACGIRHWTAFFGG